MISYALGNDTRQAKSGWHEVTLREFIELDGLSIEERAAKLCGLTLEEAERSEGLEAIWLHGLELAASEPERTLPTFIPANFSQEGVGRIELCMRFIEKAGEPQSILHYLYAAYAYQSEYHLLDCFVNNFPASLAERAASLPITQCYGAVCAILEGVLTVKSRELYLQVLRKEPSIKEINADVKRFEKYGFFAILTSVANGDILRLPQLLNTPADVFYTWLCIDSERHDYQEDFLSQSNAVR
jgi:hypothetical protein